MLTLRQATADDLDFLTRVDLEDVRDLGLIYTHTEEANTRVIELNQKARLPRGPSGSHLG